MKLDFIKKHKSLIIVLVVLLVLCVLYFNTGLCGVSGNSMYPTLRNGDLLFTNRSKDYNQGDIVILYADELGEDIVKRVIGVPGDNIAITTDGLYINNVLQKEDYVSTEDWYVESAKISVDVPDGYIFVMGDNRESSYDSRDIGLLPISCIFGTLIWDMSNTIGLSAFGFKVVLALCLLLLCTFIVLHTKKVQVITTDIIVEQHTTVPEPIEDSSPELDSSDIIPKVTISNGPPPEVTTSYWQRQTSDNSGPLLRKE